jgi:hypothetical protein
MPVYLPAEGTASGNSCRITIPHDRLERAVGGNFGRFGSDPASGAAAG